MRRLAAVVALAAPVVGMGIAVYLFFWQPMRLLAVVVSIAVGAVSIWYALTRRGLLRLLALVGVVFGLCSAINFGLGLLVVELAPLVAFGVAGGYALGRDRGALVEGTRARAAGAARHGVLIVNPRSGGGRAARHDVAGEAQRRGVETVVLAPGDDLTQLAERAVANGADVLGMAGGDGSQALVATVAARHGVAFVCVPAGTRNHFALDLGLDRDDVVGALDAFTDGYERDIDLGCVNGRVFVNNASLGVYALVVREREYRDAKFGTWARVLPDILGPQASPIDLEFDGPHGTRFTGAILILVSNNPYQFTQLDALATRPRLDTGRLGIRVARLSAPTAAVIRSDGRVRGRVVRNLRASRVGRQFRGVRGFIDWTDPAFEVRSGLAVPVGLDGETITLDPPLRFTSMPGALRVRVPPDTAGPLRVPVNAALTRRDITALVEIATGRSGRPAPPAAVPTAS
jgi:diacylglycerol kinase family enzyme